MEPAMLKFLILLPLLALAGAACTLLLLPLLAVVPVLVALALGIAIPLVILRVLASVIFGVGGLFLGIMGVTAAIVAGAVLLAIAAIAAHLLLPVLLIAGLIWLLRRNARAAPLLRLEHHPS
jgi:hypothetical protein